ncbi:hypothetical protein KCU90_g22713, partial [Aureobasidium melanogenum]
MSSDLPRDSDLATNGDSNGTSLDAPTVAPVTSTAPVSNHVENVMYSDIGINTLLNRLKQSIASSRVRPILPLPALSALLNNFPRTFPIS